ncbi:MAG: GTPase Era [Sphingobacteriales bacterium]|nr:GTPase Era [Sphingobacteriales bacterium]MBI3718007.1 GTPase Era [Sphingobacteriales bacterium]
MKAGFVNIFGKPNAGKSTLLNALIGEKLAIVSSKVQTTRHRIKGFLTTDEYQIIFSDTPGIIEPKYKLHEKMMGAVKTGLEDADVALLLVDIKDNLDEVNTIFEGLKLKVPTIVVVNKIDKVSKEKTAEVVEYFTNKSYAKKVITISALQKAKLDTLLKEIIAFLPEGEPFYDSDDITDSTQRFLVGELIREKIFELFGEEVPYQTTVLVTEFKEKSTLIKIAADIIVHRETQKGIILGERGKMIKQLGTESRASIEQFLGSKIFLELFVKVKPKWRDDDFRLKEYGYS